MTNNPQPDVDDVHGHGRWTPDTSPPDDVGGHGDRGPDPIPSGVPTGSTARA